MDAASLLPPSQTTVFACEGVPVVRYGLEANGRILAVEWLPDTPMHHLQTAFAAMVQLQIRYQCPAVLSDATACVGDWSGLIPWMRYEMLPGALAGGLRLVADVWPPDAASSLAHFAWRSETQLLLQHRFFSSTAEARQWLHRALAA